MPIEMTTQRISRDKADTLLAYLVRDTEGPREAYALLCITIWRLNFTISDKPVSVDQLCEEVKQTLQSVTEDTLQ